jgi:hypothetical protein
MSHHFADPARMPEYEDYKILYDVTADKPSGSGASEEDGLFPHNESLAVAGGGS